MATQIGIYNGALKILGEPRLASLTEAREARYALDDEYAKTLSSTLEAGQWWFATRQAELNHSVPAAPAFGYSYAFAKPADWVRTMAISSDEYFHCPLVDASDGPAHWFANITPVWIQYVSDDATTYGGLLSQWPASFERFNEYELAKRVSKQITGKVFDELLMSEWQHAKRDALNKDAMANIQPRFMPSGALVRSRISGAYPGGRHYSGRYISGTYYR